MTTYSDSTPDTPRNRGDYNAPHMTPVTPAEDMRTVLLNRVSLGAVASGVVLALVTQLILNMIGVGIGAATIDPATGETPSAQGLSIGAAIWWTVSGILAAFVGGFTAGRLAGEPRESTAGWHGLTAWAATTLVVFFLLTSVLGTVIGGAYRTVSDIATGAAQTATVAAADPTINPMDRLEETIRNMGADPDTLAGSTLSALQAAFTGDPTEAAQAREEAALSISVEQGIPLDEARLQVQRYEAEYRATATEVREDAAVAADVTADTVSRGALISAIALVLGAIAAWLGGVAGTVQPTVTDVDLRMGRRSAYH